jgi:hypothetical protein
MTPTHKVTIGNEVFMAEKLSEDIYIINGTHFCSVYFKALNAKIEEITPFRLEADVEWALDWNHKDGPGVRPRGSAINWIELIGKRGKLIFTEEV